MAAGPSQVPDKFKTLTCLEGKLGEDPLLDEIDREVKTSSVLEVMRTYIGELRGVLDNNARPFQKLARLFDAGLTPTRVEGHHDGVAIGLRTGDEQGLLASYGNFMGLLWSAAVGPVAPWVGKSFLPVEPAQLTRYTEDFERGQVPTYLGINQFNQLPDSVVNKFSFSVLSFWMNLKDVSPEEHDQYGHDRNGGLFIARRAPSVYPGTEREVFQLNYRWHNLGNHPPFTHLIDELVQIGDGIYLGQLLFATRHVLSRFDPNRPSQDYDYQHFGYFLLMDDSWAAETRRLFPHIEAGRVATAARPAGPAHPAKFMTLTFADPVDGNCNDKLCDEIRSDLAKHETILDLLHTYSRELHSGFDNQSPYFRKLDELFNRGIAPTEVRGYLRGALVSFHTEGYYRLLNVNTLNAAWTIGRFFSPWTGKTFEDITAEKLREFTDGLETGAVPTFWGTNTLVFRTVKEKLVREMMKLAGVWTEEVPPEESRKFGYDLKSFFFIARKGTSINVDNRSKKIFQFNYRWPKLRTFLPDNYCIDELVQIADGLYLGQLIYSTELSKKYDPRADPAAYNYRLFGYFLLMDEDWQKRRLEIEFDLYNV